MYNLKTLFRTFLKMTIISLGHMYKSSINTSSSFVTRKEDIKVHYRLFFDRGVPSFEIYISFYFQ